MSSLPPLSLYIHVPWCVRKCPYCDFNSHQKTDSLPEKQYVQALIDDLKTDLLEFESRELTSIFIGGGTPSLFAAESYALLFQQLQNLMPLAKGIEITLEANPGTVEQQRFSDYRQLGINRLSLGIQSFNAEHLRALGRIHDEKQAHKAVETARKAGFDNLNLDLMYGLPSQNVSQGLDDLRQALSHEPEHLSWYQLTIEPNTLFYKEKPALPSEDEAFNLEVAGLSLLEEQGLRRYEISAFSKQNRQAKHNLNYWLFGDYYGIGAGAHGKHQTSNGLVRTRKQRQPKEYLNPEKPFLAEKHRVDKGEVIFEFILNTSRLEQPIAFNLFAQTTGLDWQELMPVLKIAEQKKLVNLTATHWQVTPLGRRFTNNLQELFLPTKKG